MKKIVKKLILRYWRNEAAALCCAIAFVFIADEAYHNPIVSAYAGAVGDTVGFYLTAVARQIWYLRKDRNGLHGWPRYFYIAKRTIMNVVREHLIAEIVDLIVCRPFLLWFCPFLLGKLLGLITPWWQPLQPAHILAAGTLMGKILADAIFYSISHWRFERSKGTIK